MILEVAILNIKEGLSIDFEVGFRKSPEYQDWKALLHHFYEPFSTIEHYK